MDEDAAAGMVFGMGAAAMAEPDWPPLTLGEINEVLQASGFRPRRSDAGAPSSAVRSEAVARLDSGLTERGSEATERRREESGLRGLRLRRSGAEANYTEWRSPRPLSSTARVRLADGARWVVKRVPVALRDADALAEEHAFMDHLRAQGIPIPAVYSYTHGEFSYEFQVPGEGSDLYRDAFSWSPYLSLAHAAAAGRMLAGLHCAAEGYDAPARPPRPLSAALCTDPIAGIERHAAARPALAEFLAARDWRADLAAAPIPRAVDVSGLEPLWTHDDWHGSNLLWCGDSGTPSGTITAVLDFGLADRTTAVFDLATAIERFAVDWIALRDARRARIHTGQLAAFLRGYCDVRPLTVRERAVLPDIFPLVHVHYELSEIDYFLSVLPRPNRDNAELAYRSYLVGHLHWAESEHGMAFRDLLRHMPG